MKEFFKENMLEQFFGSKTRLKLLKIFYRNPNKMFFVRELSRNIDTQINAVRRELDLLERLGVVMVVDGKIAGVENSKNKANLRKYFKLDMNCIIHSELQALLLKENLVGEQEFIKDIKNVGGDIKLLILTGKFTDDKRAPTDVLVVGDLKEKVIARHIVEYEKEFGSDLRFTTMNEKEFADRRCVMDKFLLSIFEANHVKVINLL